MSLKHLSANNSDIVEASMMEKRIPRRFSADEPEKIRDEYIPYAEAISVPVGYRILSLVRSLLLKHKSDV